MSNFEVILSVCFVFISMAALIGINYFKNAWYDMMDIWQKDKETIKKIAYDGAFDGILSVDKFNNWFVNNKNPEIYANEGIYLRLDKLSEGHISDYVFDVTRGVVRIDDFNQKTIKNFEIEIRSNWQNQLRAK